MAAVKSNVSEMETQNVDAQSGNAENSEKPKKSYHFDILALVLWLVIMWGFLIALSVTDSPKDQAGTHELLAYIYFLGFTFVYAAFYILALKKGV